MPTITELASARAKLKAPTFQRIADTIVPEMSMPQIIDSLKSDVAKKKMIAISRIKKTKHLSQGFPLINPHSYAEAVKLLQEKIACHDRSLCKRFYSLFGPYVDIEADKKILALLINPDAIQDFVPEDTRERMQSKTALTATDKFLIQNSRYKLKVLFMQFEKMKVAQAQLMSLSVDLANNFDGNISQPPGAFEGLKSFAGALDKITLRERSSDYGDLKDVARMSVEFDTIDAMTAASNYLGLSKEFFQLKSFQKSLKNRYKSGSNPHDCGATAEGYRDIKYFLQMDGGIIGELQLNTKSMLVAKSKAHHIYDLTRAAKVDAMGMGKITSKELITQAVQAFDDKWFLFVSPRISGASVELLDIKRMVARMSSTTVAYFEITPKELTSLKFVSCKIYAEIGPPSTMKPLFDAL